MGVFVLLYTDLSIYLLETLSLSLSYMYIYLLINKQIRGCISIPRTYAHLLHHASCLMQYAYICPHTHTHMHTVPKYLRYMQYYLMHVCVSGLLDSVSGWEQGTSGGKKGKRKKKMQTHQPLHTALYCTALHGRVVVSPRLAWPRIASLRFAQSS